MKIFSIKRQKNSFRGGEKKKSSRNYSKSLPKSLMKKYSSKKMSLDKINKLKDLLNKKLIKNENLIKDYHVQKKKTPGI